LQYTFEVPKPTLVKLAFNHILQFLGMIAWGVGAMPLNIHAKLEHDEDLAFVIGAIQTEYAKELKGV
jgi:hypothetical protein